MASVKGKRSPKRKNMVGRTAKFVKGRKERINENVVIMSIIGHDAGNALNHAEGALNFGLERLRKGSKAEKLLSELKEGVLTEKTHYERMQAVLHSRKVYLWKRSEVWLRSKRIIARDRRFLERVRSLKKKPEIALNSVALEVVNHVEKCLKAHILRTRRLLSRRLANPVGGMREPLNVNRFIKEFLADYGEIRDKEGFLVKVELEGGKGLPRMMMNRADLDIILENLLTDATTHPFLRMGAKKEKEYATVKITTRLSEEGLIEINFLSVGGEPMSEFVLKNLGDKQYTVTGKKSRGLGKISVKRTAKKYNGDLDKENTPDGPLLTVTLQPASS